MNSVEFCSDQPKKRVIINEGKYENVQQGNRIHCDTGLKVLSRKVILYINLNYDNIML